MSKFFKSMFLLLSAGLFTATGWAETYTATNVSVATGADGGAYDWAQFKFVDVQNAITNEAGDSVNAEAVSEYLDVTSVAILRRSGKGDWSNTITVNLMTADGTSVLTNGTSSTLTTEEVTIGGNSQKWMVFAFENPVRISKNTIYRIKTSSGGQQYFMSNVSGKTGKNNTSILASGSQDSFSPFVRIVATSVDLSEFSRTIASGENNWSESDVWQSGGMTFTSPTEGTIANLSVTGEATLMMNASASVALMNISGNDPLTIATDGTYKLTADTTTIDADTTVNAGAANLGTVTINAEKTLTVKDNATVESIAGGTLAIDATAGNITFGDNTALTLDEIRAYAGVVTLNGTASTGTTLSFPYNSSTSLSAQLVYASGTHSLNYGRSVGNGDGLFATGKGDATPTIWVKSGATLNFALKDLSGWNGSVPENPAVIRVENGAALNLKTSGGTGFFRDRLVLDNGAVVTNVDNNFILHGGASDDATKAQIAMLDSNTVATATFNGTVYLRNTNGGQAGTKGASIAVGENATLTMAKLASGDTADTLKKLGNGTLKLLALENMTNKIQVSAGTLALATNATLTNTITNNGTITADTATVDLTGATILGNGTYGVTNNGTLILSLAQTAGKTIDVADGATLKVALAANEQLVDQSVTVTGNGSVQFVDANNHEKLSDGSTYTPQIAEYTYTVVEDGTGDWDATPAADAKITIAFGATENKSVDLSTILGDVTSVAMLSITGDDGGTIEQGNNTLTIATLDLQTNVTMTGAFLKDCVTAHTTVTVPENKTLSISVPYGGTDWDCALKHSFDGAGTVKKMGAGSLSIEDAYGASFTCAPALVIAEGAFRFASSNSTNYTNLYNITIENGAMLKLGYGSVLTHANSTITMNDGAIIEAKNGNNGTATVAQIFVNGDVTIKGSWAGDSTTFGGKISGNGTLTIDQVEAKRMAFNGVIANGEAGDSLKVIIKQNAAAITFSGANTYTGGTEIEAGATLINADGSALGTGKVTGAGTLIVNIGKHPGNHDRFGFADATSWTGTVEFTGGNFATPVEFSKWQNANSKFKVASGATVFAANGHTFAGTLMGAGTITNTLAFAEDATLDTTAGTLTATGTVNFGETLNVKVSGDDIVGTQILKKADANITEEVGVENVTVLVNGAEGYCLAQNAEGYVLREKVENPELSVDVAGGTTSLSAALGENELAANTILTINFGDGTTPGIFTFDIDNDDDISFAQIIVTGTNGGRISKSETADAVSATLATINTAVTVDAGVATFTATEIPAEGALTVADTATVSAVSGAGVLAYNGVLPANVTGLDAATWTGTLALVSTPAQADIAFNDLGNASSMVRLQDYTGSLSNKTAATCYTPNLEIKGTNTIDAATAYAIPIFQGDVSGDGTIVFSATENTNYLFSGDFSAFTGTMELTHTSPKIAIGAASNTNWNAWNPIVNNGNGNITIATAATLNGIFRAVSGVETTSSAILSGNGTIDCSLALAANATIDASETLLTVTGDITLPNTLTVKVATTPTVVNPVTILTTTATPNVTNTAVTVIVNAETLEGTFELVKNGDKLQVRVAPDRIAASETPVPVTEVPEGIFLDTATFSGYGQTFTVLQYTGGTTDWEGMYVEGLPEGAEIIKTDTTWGFAIKTLNVLTVGDSITAGLVTYHNSNANWHVPGGYRLPLYKYLTRAGYSVKYLGSSDVFGTSSVGGGNANEANPSPSLGDNDHHEGHSGITLVTMLERFNNTNVQNEIASQGTPDVITLHLGTNDIMGVDDNTTDDAISADAEKVLTRMKNLLNRLQELYPNTKILVAKIIARSGNKNKVVTEFNKKLNTFFESNQEENLILVDLGINSVSYGLLRYDGLHPSTEGYTQMAKGWFNAIEAEFEPLGDSMEAPTPATSTPMEDVNESDRTVDTVGMAGVLKAAEWTTFTGFATGFTSQFGYMPDSERPWQLDVRGTNEPEVADGVLSLNGAPITVNPVDGRLGTTKSTYTIVMKVSDLAANDVIFTDSSVRNDDWPENVNTNYKGTTNADLLKMTVGNATTLKVQYKENSEQTVSLTDVDLTDATPEVIAVVVKQNAFSIFVNGTKVATDVSLGGAINESYRGSFSIGALSADNAGSAMKLYRLSFYEGEVTAIAAPIATTATINVGEGAGQYITWETAKEALKLSDEMESLTINFTADAQTFTFDNDAAVTIDAVTVQGTAGGTIANDGTATVTATNLVINTNVTMNKCYIVDKNTLPIETTTDIAIAQNCVLTYYINGAMSTVTVAATHSGAGKIAKTSYGTLEITNTCAVNVDVNQGQFKVNVPINGEKKSIENQKTVKLTGSTLILTSGLSYATFDGDETSIIRVDGDYTFGISNSFTNDLDAGEIQIDAGKTLTIRNFKSGYVLSPSKLLRVNGTLQRDGSHGQDFKVSIPATSTLEGSGSITQAIELADGATVHCAATALAVNTVTFAEGTLNVTGADALAEGETVTLFRTTAYAAATGLVEGVVARRAATADETDYRLYKTADAIEVWPSATDAETWTVDATTATTWADVVNQMAAANKRPADTTALTIDFGDIDGEAVPGTFTFGEGDVTLGSLTVIGSNGGTITTTGTVMVSTSAAINTAVAVTGQIQLNGATIAADAELAITNYAVLGTQVSGAGTLKITGATLSRGLDADIVSNTWTGTVILEDVDDNNLDLRYLVNDSITSADDTLTITASSSLTIKGMVKAYIYDCAIDTLTLDGTLQMCNGTTNKSYTQCVMVDTLAGAGAFIGHQSSEVCIAVNVKSWRNFTGSIDLSNEKSKNTIFFFGTAPKYFATSITPGNVGADDSDFTDADYGTLYVTEGDLVTAVGSTWKAPKVNIANGTSLTIQGWFGASESITGLSANTIVGGVKNNEDEVVEAGVLDLRALDDLSGINATVKAGGRILVKSGASVPDSIVFESKDAILGICPASVDDIGSATLTVTAEGTANSVATKKGYKTDGVTELGNWADKDDDTTDNKLSFGYDPIFDGELCWWAYEFDNEVNTTAESNLAPISTGRDKTRMTFDDRGNSNRHCEGNEYVVTSTDNEGNPVTQAIRLASGAYRSATWPEAGFTAAAYGRLTPNYNRVLFAFGQTSSKNPTIALATGASANAVQLVLIAGRQDATTPWTPDTTEPYASPITVLAETTVPNATTEDHLFAFSYELKDTNDDGTKDATEIIFYVDGDKYQPYKVNKVLTIGGGFQMGTTFGGVPDQYLTRMNEEDANSTIEFLRVYDKVLPPETFTAMANAYLYISKVGRATRTIVAGVDSTWHESSGDPLTGEWSQTTARKNGEDYVYENGALVFDTANVEKPTFGTIDEPEVGTQVVLNVDGANTLYLNEFYSTTKDPETGDTSTNGNSKLYYERLEINGVADGAENDSLTMWAGRLNENEDPAYKDSQSAVLTVLGYTKINTNVTFAHNVAYLSGPVAVAEGKYLHFDFSGFDVMKVPSMPVTYRLTGFLDEETRTRVTSTAPAEPVNARSIDLGYKTDVNQYTFTVDRYPVTAYFTADEMAGGNSTEVDFNDLNYVWQGNDLGKPMNWEAEAVDPQGNPIVENTLAKFVSLDAETQQEKMVTVTLATNDVDPITLTLAESALSKETTPAGTDGEGNPTEAVVENMLGEQQLIVGNNVIVNYTGTAATLARTLNEASAETTGVIRTAGFRVDTVDGWRANLSVTGGALAGVGTISGKVTFEAGATLDASAATAEACLSAKDADLTNLKAIKVNVGAAEGKTLKVLSLPAGHTAKSLEGCVVTAVDGEGETVATWTETGDAATLVVVRADGLYVTGRPLVKAGETEVKNNDLTLPLARRAAELSATSVSLTAVKSLDGMTTITTDAESVATAAECFTGIAFDVDKAENSEVATASLRYNFGVSQINVVTIGGTQYVVAELIVSNHTDLDQNSAAYADGTTIDVTVTLGDATPDVEVEAAADMTGATVAPAAVLPASTRYVRFPMPSGNGTFEIKARASK